MANSRRDLSKELERRLTWEEYSMASYYLNDATRLSDQAIQEDTESYDSKIRDFLICAKDVYQKNGDYHCANVIDDYIRLF